VHAVRRHRSLPGASPAGPSQAISGSWRRSLGGGAAQPSTSNESEAGRRSQASIRGGGSGASASASEYGTRSRDNLAAWAQWKEGGSDMFPPGRFNLSNPPEDEKYDIWDRDGGMWLTQEEYDKFHKGGSAGSLAGSFTRRERLMEIINDTE
jgi:hypothetical protein